MAIHIVETGCDHQVALPLSQFFHNSTSMEVLCLSKLIYLFILHIILGNILISVGDNKIGSEGCVSIVQALRQHQKLKTLVLGKNIFVSGRCITYLIIYIGSTIHSHILYIDNCDI